MELGLPTSRPVKAVATIALLAWAALVSQQADDFSLTPPIKPVLDAAVASTGGTATAEGGYRSPDAPIDDHRRMAQAGAAIS